MIRPGSVLSPNQQTAGNRGNVYVKSLKAGARFSLLGMTGVVRYHSPSSTAIWYLDQPIIDEFTGERSGTRKIKTYISSNTLVKKSK